MTSLNTNLYLLLENLLFLVLATSFIVIVGWGWRHSKPFSLPEPLPRLLRWEFQENTDTFSE